MITPSSTDGASKGSRREPSRPRKSVRDVRRTPWTVGVVLLSLLGSSCIPFRSIPRETVLPHNRIELRLLLHTHDPLVEATINGKGPFVFEVDTGCGGSILSPRVVEQLDLDALKGDVKLTGFTGATQELSEVFWIDELALGQARYRGFHVISLATQYDGVLGFDFFSESLMTLDFPNRRLILERASLTESLPGVMPYRLIDQRPYVVVASGEKSLESLVDTGNNAYFFASMDLQGEFPTLAAPVYLIGEGFVAEALYPAARLSSSLRIGQHVVHQPIVAFGDENNLGTGILKHFTVTFDQSRKLIRFARKSEGLITIPPVEGYGFVVGPESIVYQVVPGSRAEKAGLKVGDRLIDFDDADLSPLDEENPPPVDLKIRRPERQETLEISVPWGVVIW